jgi:hypothetical protein
VIDDLCGIAPPLPIDHPTSSPVESEQIYYGSVLRADPEVSRRTHPTLWKHMYKLSEKKPAQSVLDAVGSDPVLKAKPDSAYVGCRPCLAVIESERICKTWKNDGGVLSNIKRHFQEDHHELFVISYPISQNTIKQETTASSATGPVDMDDFVEKMVTWIVADDMVRISLLTSRLTHMHHYSLFELLSRITFEQ